MDTIVLVQTKGDNKTPGNPSECSAAVWVCGGTYDLPLMLMPLGSFVDTIRLKADQGPRSGQTQLATQCLLRAVLLCSPEREELYK